MLCRSDSPLTRILPMIQTVLVGDLITWSPGGRLLFQPDPTIAKSPSTVPVVRLPILLKVFVYAQASAGRSNARWCPVHAAQRLFTKLEPCNVVKRICVRCNDICVVCSSKVCRVTHLIYRSMSHAWCCGKEIFSTLHHYWSKTVDVSLDTYSIGIVLKSLVLSIMCTDCSCKRY